MEFTLARSSGFLAVRGPVSSLDAFRLPGSRHHWARFRPSMRLRLPAHKPSATRITHSCRPRRSCSSDSDRFTTPAELFPANAGPRREYLSGSQLRRAGAQPRCDKHHNGKGDFGSTLLSHLDLEVAVSNFQYEACPTPKFTILAVLRANRAFPLRQVRALRIVITERD